jgi:hypothetical protein
MDWWNRLRFLGQVLTVRWAINHMRSSMKTNFPERKEGSCYALAAPPGPGTFAGKLRMTPHEGIIRVLPCLSNGRMMTLQM